MAARREEGCRRLWRGAVLALALTTAAAFSVSPAAPRETYAAYVARINAGLPGGATYRDDLEQVLLSAANAYRKSKGLKPLRAAEGTLVAAARAHAADMMQNDFVGHTSSSGAGFESRMRALHPGVMMLPRMAENAARERSKGEPDKAKARKLFQQWVNSGPHARTLRSRDYVSLATGVVEKDGKLFAVQIFEGPALNTNMFGTAGAPTPKTETSGPVPEPAEGGGGLY